jgi:hypothetical protein
MQLTSDEAKNTKSQVQGAATLSSAKIVGFTLVGEVMQDPADRRGWLGGTSCLRKPYREAVALFQGWHHPAQTQLPQLTCNASLAVVQQWQRRHIINHSVTRETPPPVPGPLSIFVMPVWHPARRENDEAVVDRLDVQEPVPGGVEP